MEKAVAAALRKLPSVDELMRHATLVQAKERFGRTTVVSTVRKVLAEARKSGSFVSNDDFASRVGARLEDDVRPNLRPVFNLTGTVLHTNLGEGDRRRGRYRSGDGRHAQRGCAGIRSGRGPPRRTR